MAIFSAIASVISGIGAAAGAIGSALGGGGLSAVAGLIGTGVSVFGAIQGARGEKRAEALRMRQMNLQATRDRRQTIRQAIVARSQALSQATAQGAQDGSGIQGGMSQIQGQAASNIQGINQGQQIGSGIFQANSMISWGNTLGSIGQGIQGFGSFLSSSREQMNRNPWGIKPA